MRFIRMKLALTEVKPIIKPYDEAAWALLPDARGPIEVSLVLLEALHSRWVELLRGFSDSDWQRGFVHPECLNGRRPKLPRIQNGRKASPPISSV